MAVFDFLEHTLEDVGSGELGKTSFQSSLFSFTINPLDQTAESSGLGNLMGKLVRPKITIKTPAGDVTVAPYGEPPAFPWLGVVVAVGIVGGVVLIAWKLRNP